MRYLLKEPKCRSEFKAQEQQMHVTKGDVLKDIKDERMVEVSNQKINSERVKLGEKLDELWVVMSRHSRRMCNMEKEEMNYFFQSK